MRRRPRPIVWPRSYGDSGIKASATGPLIATHVAHTPQYTPRRYDRLADEGFTKNVIAYQCVQLRADAVASLRWLIFKGDKEVADHEIKRLLKRQNPMTYGPRWWRELAAFHSIAGNAYVEAVGPRPTEPPLELWNLRPDRMKVIPGDDGMPEAYRYEVNGQTRDFPVNLVAGAMQLLHIKEFHPLNDWYGMSPVEAAARYIDMDNAASDHNLGRLQNGANPSGLVVFKEKLLPDQAKAAEEKIQAKLGGARNAGRIQVVGGGEWDFKRVGDSNVDMQWLEGMSETARRICAAWNVPHILIVAGESTYNNRENARVEFWVHNVLPYVDKLLGDLNPWLARMYGDEDLELRYDRQAIAALEPVRRATREQARADFQAQLITKNEARLEIDYGEVDGGDEFAPVLANIPNQANAQQNFDLQQEGLDRADAREANKRPQVEKDAETAHQRALELEDRRAKNRQGTKDGGGPARKAEDPFSATDEPPAEPFYAYLEVQAPRRLTRWMRSVGIPKPVAAGKLHLTTVYSAIPPKGYEPSARTETLDPARYRLERLGPDGAVLALVVDSDLAWDRMQAAMAAGAVPAWPTLIPHITLSYDAGEFQIPDHPPDFPITVGPEVIGSSRKGNYPKISDGWGIEARADEPDFSDIPDSLNDDILADTARPSLLGIVRDFGQRTIQRISVTLGFDVRSPAVEGFLARWGGERIRDLVGTTTRRELGEALARVTAEGPTFPKLVAAVQATFDRADKVRAEVIARTETTRAAGFGSQEGMVQGNVERKQWISSRDAFVRDAHAELDGQIVEADQPYVWEGNKAMFPGDFAKAALSINCFAGETKVRANATAALRSLYSGKMVHVETAAGRRLTVTPNHPVMTRSGWKPAGALRYGDQLVCYRGDGDLAFRLSPEQSENNTPPAIDEVFSALAARGFGVKAWGRPEDFHGDARFVDGQINVVGPNRELLHHIAAARAYRFSDLDLEAPDAPRLGQGFADTLIEGGDRTTAGLPSSGALPFDGTGVGPDFRPLESFSVGTPPDLDAALAEASVKNNPLKSADLAKSLQRHSPLVELDEVIEVRDFYTRTHVYDLVTTTGLIIANGIFTSNCRCVSIAIPDEASAARLATKDARTVEWSEQDNLLLHHERILVAALREGFGRQKRGILQALARSFAMTLRAKAYNPSQPRSPAGTPTGGQWVAHGGLAGGAWRGALTPDEKASVTAYSGGEYRLVNRAARGEKLPEPHRTTAETITGHLAAALEKAALEEPATVWRGALFDDISAFKKGAEFRDAAFLSTSASRGVAEEFMSINSSRKKVLFELKLHAGAKAAELGDLAKKPGEREILVQRGANFRIVGAPKKLNKNAIHVTLEIIENGKRAPMTDRKKAQNQADEQQEPRVDELRGGKYLWGDGDLELTKPGEEDPQDDDED